MAECPGPVLREVSGRLRRSLLEQGHHQANALLLGLGRQVLNLAKDWVHGFGLEWGDLVTIVGSRGEKPNFSGGWLGAEVVPSVF